MQVERNGGPWLLFFLQSTEENDDGFCGKRRWKEGEAELERHLRSFLSITLLTRGPQGAVQYHASIRDEGESRESCGGNSVLPT